MGRKVLIQCCRAINYIKSKAIMNTCMSNKTYICVFLLHKKGGGAYGK